MKSEKFAVTDFWSALDNVRISRGLTWKQVAEESGVSASTLTRISQGKHPDMDGFTLLIRWSGLDPDRFVGSGANNAKIPENGDSLDSIAAHLRADRNLTPKARIFMEMMIKSTYQKMLEDQNMLEE